MEHHFTPLASQEELNEDHMNMAEMELGLSSIVLALVLAVAGVAAMLGLAVFVHYAFGG